MLVRQVPHLAKQSKLSVGVTVGVLKSEGAEVSGHKAALSREQKDEVSRAEL